MPIPPNWRLQHGSGLETGADIAATSASYTAVEADEGESLSVTATYSDGLGGVLKTATGSVVGTVLPATNSPPEIAMASDTATHTENAESNVVETYTAMDADDGDEATLTWSLTTGDADFDISDMGAVSFTDPPNL